MGRDFDLFEAKQLMIRAKTGDSEAYAQLYSSYYVPVFRFLCNRVSDKEVAEDLVQTVFVKVYEAIDRFQLREVSPIAYFMTVARHAVIDYYRKKKELLIDERDHDGDHEPVFEAIADPDNNPLQMLQKIEDDARITNALKQISPEQQELISLKFLQGLSIREVAQVLKKSEASIRQLQVRALKSLKEKLKHAQH